jgi:UDP-glucose 4-epimerase
MRILVTGGAGYIGSVLVEELLAQKHTPIVYDNLNKGHRQSVAPGVEFIEGELLDRHKLESVMITHRIEAVMHMAADSLVEESFHNPSKYYANNVAAGFSLLEAMRSARVSRIIFSSTAAVYREPDRQPIQESDSTVPTNPYGETKLAFERALHWYEQAYGLRYVSLRYFNAAGATERCGEQHDPETHLIPLMLQVAAGNRPPLKIFGDDYPTRDGTCVRDYIHVSDLARAHVLALGILSRQSEIFNLGCGGGFTVLEVIEAARQVTSRPIPIRMGPRRSGDPRMLIASSRKIQTELGWQPKQQDLCEITESALNSMRIEK